MERTREYRPATFDGVARNLGIRNESDLKKFAKIIKMAGWGLASDEPDDETIDRFKRKYDDMIEAARKMGDCSMKHSINGMNSRKVVGYLEGLGETYGVGQS